MRSVAETVLLFWFGNTDLSADIPRSSNWFKASETFDQELKDKFEKIHRQATLGKLDHFMETAAECLALLIILDQFSRNLHRNSPKAFEADSKTREIARTALANNFDKEFSNWPKIFCYLPFEHSEFLDDHEFISPYFEALEGQEFENSRKTAREHMKVIQKYGRYPHRNNVMGRINTPEEEKYLENPPLWGKTKAEAAEILKRRKNKKESKAS